MRSTYFIHILAGSLGLIAGYIALYAAKGGDMHRKAGMLFVYAMLVMCGGGVLMAAVRGVAPSMNIPAGLLTATLIITALTTVRPPSPAMTALTRGAMVLTLVIGVSCFKLGLTAMAEGGRQRGFASPLFIFGTIAMLAFVGDLRMMRTGPLRGGARLARHLWRMCFALFVAAGSFFLGQADMIPAPYRHRGLLALPVLAVLVTMAYWLWRVRARRGVRHVDPVLVQATAS